MNFLFGTDGDLAHQTTSVHSLPVKSLPQRKHHFMPSSKSPPRCNSRSACTTSSTVQTLHSSPNSSFEDPSSPEKRNAHSDYYDVEDDDGENCQAGGCFGEWIINKFSPPSRVSRRDVFSPAVAHSPDSRHQRRTNGMRHSVITPTKLELTSNSCENDLTDGCSCSSTPQSSIDSPRLVHIETTDPTMRMLGNILSLASKAEDDCNINAAIAHLENYLCQLHHRPNLSLESNRASVLHKLGCLQWQCGRYRLSLCALVEACAVFDSLIKDSGTDVQPTLVLASANVLVSMGRLHLSNGAGAAAMHCFRECVHRLSSVQNDRSASARIFAQACNGAGRVLLAQAKLSPALKRFKRALKVQLGQDVEDIAAVSLHTARVPLQEIAETLSYLGRLYEEQNNLQMAMMCYSKSSRIISTALGPNHVDAGEVSNRLGRILHKLGRFSEADQAIRRAHQIFVNNLGEYHRNTAAAMLSLGMLYASQGNHKRAQTIYQQTLRAQHATFNGEVHSDLALVFHCIAKSYEESFKLEKAIQYYNEELFVLKTCLHPFHLDIANLLRHMAMVTMNIVDNDGSYLMVKESIEWLEEAAGIYEHHNKSNAFHKEMQSLHSSIQKLRRRQIANNIR